MPQSLCESCEKMREVCTARSRFLLCELALADAKYTKYPPQPVVRCGGHRVRGEAKPDSPGEPPPQDT